MSVSIKKGFLLFAFSFQLQKMQNIRYKKGELKKQTARSKRHEAGFSLVEILVASSIIVVSLIAVINIANKAINSSRQSVNAYLASTLLEEGAEAVRTIRDNDWTNISALSNSTTYYPKFTTATNTWSLTTTAVDGTVGVFSRSVVLSAVNRDASANIASSGTLDASTKLVTVTVSWLDGTTTHSKTLQFYTFAIF